MDLKKIAVDKSINVKEARLACDVVMNYVIKNKLVMYGGLAIDYALRLHGENIYPDYEIPDYDFYSNDNITDAYKIFEEIARADVGPVSVMPAYHAGTMKVRLYGIYFVADSSYLAKRLYKIMKLTALTYKGILFRHPYLQYVDQHRALSYPFEKSGVSPVILNRWKKDFTRFRMLYEHYPVNDKIVGEFLANLKFKQCNPAYDKYDFKLEEGVVYSGLIAYRIYEYLLTGLELPDKVDIVSIVAEEKDKTFVLPGKMIHERAIEDDIEYIIPDEATGYHVTEINGINVSIVNINFLILHMYTLMILDYKNKNTSYAMRLYLRCIQMTIEGWEKDIPEFFPSIVTLGYKKDTKFDKYVKLNGNDVNPPQYNYNVGDDIDEIVKEIPVKNGYNPIFEFD